MIRLKLQDLMWQRRIRSVSELSRSAGISRQTVDALFNRPDQIKGIQFETLERLCRALKCQVEDIIQYIPDDAPDIGLDIEVVAEGDVDYAVFADLADESATPLEDCDELFERLDLMRRQHDRQG